MSVALMQRAVTQAFGGKGAGQQVIAQLDRQPGNTYRFRLENAGGVGPWWKV